MSLEERLRELEGQVQALTRIPYRPPGVVLQEDDALVSTDVSPRFRILNFIGASVDRDGDVADIRINKGQGGAGPFEYDYLIDANWAAEVAAGRGTEGEQFTTFHGHTFKVYSSFSAAVTDANANRQATLQSTSFMIVGTGVESGTPATHYQEATTIDLQPPNSGSYLIYGSGPDSVTIEGTMTSGALFNIPTQVIHSVIMFQNIELRATQDIDLIRGTGSTRVVIDNCWLRPNSSSAKAVNTGNAGIGWNISNTNIEGAGVAIGGGTIMQVRLTNCYVGTTRGIEMVNDTEVQCANVQFSCTEFDVFIGATTGAFLFTAVGCEFEKGIRFGEGAGAHFFDHFVVSGCMFNLGAGEVGIDYAGATGSGALLAAESHSIVGNTFRGALSAIGIRGGSATADGPKHVTVVGNSFEGFTADNEIIDMDRAADGNEIAHNTTDSGATLPNTGVGHSTTAVAAPSDADYLVGTANAGLSAEIVAGTTPGGELGGTWGSPTVDATHSGSAHHADVQNHTIVGLADVTAPSTTVPYTVIGPMPAAGTITGVEAVANENLTNGATSTILDVHKILAANVNTDGQGTTIFTTQANRPTISNTNKKSTTTAPDVTAFAAGDYFAFYCDQQGTTLTFATIGIRCTIP